MIAVDTNVLARYATRDDPLQAQVASAFLQNNECLVLRTVALELVWVLASGYGLSRASVV